MSSAGTPLRPSVFISYASEDRAAARLLRDTLSAAGLEVWYDESELGGGDAWDQKIRRQIRDCDYFLAVVSATTQRRKEGYFRREWRLAAERTMDMADDVLFLLPVSIDETSEAGARVPEKFLTVQWLRAPAGQTTPALDALIQRLLAGEHTIVPRPPMITRPPMQPSMTVPPMALPPPPAVDHGDAPPPMPPFPHAPEKGGVGHWLKFVAEILWWFVTAIWVVTMRLPRWARVIVMIWLIITALSMCNRSSDSKSPSRPRPKGPPPAPALEAERAANAVGEQIGAIIEKGIKEQDWGKLGEELGRRFGKNASTRNLMGKQLLLVAFTPGRQDPAATQLAQTVFAASYGKLLLARPADAALAPRLPSLHNDQALAAMGRELKVDTLLDFQVTKSAEGSARLSARLIRSLDGSLAWSAEFPVAGADAAAIADKVTAEVLAVLPVKK